MALPSLPLNEILVMNAAAREQYFMEYARYMPDAPQKPYMIRLGSRSLFSHDTMELREKFESQVRLLRRQSGLKVSR
jgi:hypothetical protein